MNCSIIALYFSTQAVSAWSAAVTTALSRSTSSRSICSCGGGAGLGWVTLPQTGQGFFGRRPDASSYRSQEILEIQEHISEKYGQDSILKDGLLGDQTLSAVIQAARLGDSEAIQFAQKYGIDYSKEPSSFGISGGTPNGNVPTRGGTTPAQVLPTGGTTTKSTRGGTTPAWVLPTGGTSSGGVSLPSVSKDNKAAWDDFAKGNSSSKSQQIKNKKDKNKNTNKTSTKYSFTNTPQRYSNGIENGPVTYTGLAMLHGTPSAPEYVLNSDQAYSLLRYMATNSPQFTPINSSGNVTYSYGDIIMNGVNDPEKFFSELTSAMDRKYSTTKNRK